MDNSTPVNKNNGIYLDLDSILDTRLSLLFTFDPNLAKDVITHGYTSRDEDVFPGISKEVFASLYSKRTTNILFNATITKLIKLVNEFIV